MEFGGFLKQSLIDYPGKVSSVVFTLGCNLRCKYCHNSSLVLPERIIDLNTIDEEEVLAYLEKNKALLDALVITGGEPTLYIRSLMEFIKKVRDLGLKVKLDTNGTNPELLSDLIAQNMIDFVSMDIKAPLNIEKYTLVAGNIVTENMLDDIKKSISVIINSGIEHEFRTTVPKSMLTKSDIYDIVNQIQGAGNYTLQKFNPNGDILDKEIIEQEMFVGNEFNELSESFTKEKNIQIR